jgi:integrase
MAHRRGGRLAMGVYKRNRVWWYRFTWKGEVFRESTKQSNKRVAKQIEAAHKTSLAKGEVGIRDRVPAATIRQFTKVDFLRQDAGMKVTTVNRELQVLRRMFALFMLRDAATILLDCGIRPEECFRLRWENCQNGSIEITHGKTENARRRIPPSQRAHAILEMRRGQMEGPWILPAPTRSGHIEPSTLQGQHAKACKLAKVEHFPLYTFRHTCLTRWAPFMDPWTLAYLAGHRDMSITRRYVHPQEFSTRAAMERARVALSGHNSGHTPFLNTKTEIGDLALKS